MGEILKNFIYMKKYSFLAVVFCFLFSALQTQTHDDYLGRYCVTSLDSSIQNMELDLCVIKTPFGIEQTYVLYKKVSFRNLNEDSPYSRLDDIVEISTEKEIGYFQISDTSLVFFSNKDSLKKYEFLILDSLNLEVIYSKENHLPIGNMIHRICRYFPENQCGWYLSKDFNCKWFIEKNIINDTIQYECYYINKPQVFYYFHYDSIKVLPQTIYKYKEGQYRKY